MAAVLSTGAAFGQLIDASVIQTPRSSRSGLPMMISARGGAPLYHTPAAMRGMRAEDVAQVFLTENGHLMGITDVARELSLKMVETDSIGFSHTTYEQVYSGIPVFSGIVKVHQDAAGDISSVNGRFYRISAKLEVTPLIDGAAAEQIAAGLFPGIETQAFHNQLVIVDPGWYGDPPKGAKLAYYLKLKDNNLQVEEGFFIDARSGQILDHWSLVHRAKSRSIFDGAESSVLPGNLSRTEGQPPVTAPTDTNRAYDYYGDTYDFYSRAFGRDSINGLGMTMVATVRSTAPGCPNAFWSGSLGQMVFCTGTVTDDIVGHELTHGVTEFTSNLIYQNQPGQLNESMSDIFGELIDLFNGNAAFAGVPGGTAWPTHPTGPGVDTPNNARSGCSIPLSYGNGVRWLVGEDATVFGGAIRDMFAPSCLEYFPGFPYPDRANSPANMCESFDSGGVHIGSSIPNHAFAIMVDGKSFNGFTVTGIGPIKAGAIWYRAQTKYLTAGAGFEDAYWAINQAATDLIGTTPNDPRTGTASASAISAQDAAQVDMALQAVEMNTPGACGQPDDVLSRTPPTLCSGRTTIFFEDFEGSISAWQRVTNPTPFTQYQWVQTTTPLPVGRLGKAMFCDDLNSSCAQGSPDQSATHSLISPPIIIPASTKPTYVAFTHFVSTEGVFDGGNLKYSTNGGALWSIVPRSMFIYSPTNGRVRNLFGSNSNPMNGQDVWTGSGGGWGTTVLVDKSNLLAGHTVQFRFDFGKDYCGGVDGWYVDDFEVFTCPDCLNDGSPNDASFQASFCSPVLLGFSSVATRQFGIGAAPTALSDVRVTCFASADLGLPDEFLTILMNNVSIGTIFADTGVDCAQVPERATLTVPAATFNALRDPTTFNVTVKVQSSVEVDADVCGSGMNSIALQLEYDRSAEKCVPPPAIFFGDFPTMAVCVNSNSPPLGPTPLVTGGTPPFSYTWRVTAGEAAFDPLVIHSQHPMIKPTAPGENTIELEVTDQSVPPQTVTKSFTLLVGDKVTVDSGLYLRYHPIVTVGQVLAFGSEFTATGGLAPYTFEWSLEDNPNNYATLDTTDPLNPTFVTTQPGTYTINLLVRELAGCTASTQFSLTAVLNGPMSRPNTGGDGTDGGNGSTADPCGVGTALCAPTGIVTIAGCMIGFGWIRGRMTKRRRR
ncbi:MAG: M4 family metallopeptidase [Planctomycetes bacterium]|nr:M4 family metallopeptidase [Planctomycetota bacterium]